MRLVILRLCGGVLSRGERGIWSFQSIKDLKIYVDVYNL